MKLEFLPRQVWQEDESSIDDSILSEICRMMEDSGFKINKRIDMNNVLCYTESDRFITVFHNGDVDKCANMPLDEVKGYLSDNGEILYNSSIKDLYKSIFDVENACIQCEFLPLCMGPCLVHRRYALERQESFRCPSLNKESHFNKFIIDYVESFKN